MTETDLAKIPNLGSVEYENVLIISYHDEPKVFAMYQENWKFKTGIRLKEGFR